MIPDEAVEAAARALRDKYALEVCELPISSFLGDAGAALEAAAPHMRSSAWDDGFTACAYEHMAQERDPSHPITRTNPYRSQS